MNSMTLAATTETPSFTDVSSIIVKVQYGDDIRRFSFAGTSFSALKEEVYKRYSFKPQTKVTLKYADEESDLITVSDDAELADAINIACKQGTLKLSLFLAKKKIAVAPSAPAAPIDPITNNSATSGVVPAPVPNVNSTGLYPAVSAPAYTPVSTYHASAPAHYAPVPSAPAYVAPPFRSLDRQAKLERMQQWKEMKKQRWEQKKACKQDKKAVKEVRKNEKKCEKREKHACPHKIYARFVKDVGVEDGTELAPGTRFIKTWRFRNEGPEAWPQGSKLIFISWKGGDQMSGPESIPVTVTVLPGAEVDISAELVTPVAPGRYAGHYRLCTPEGRKFGDRVRNLVYVVDPTSPSSTSSSEGEQSYCVFAPALAQLDQMGFHHKKCNIKMLKKCNGDLNKAIQKLVKKQRKADRKKHY